jgi:glycosyltransferase involved in cell wall biosynthesis
LTSGHEGLLVSPPDEPSGFAAALQHLLESPGERSRMGAAGRLTATSLYSWGTVAAQLEAYYLELRGETPAPLLPPRARPHPEREAPTPV